MNSEILSQEYYQRDVIYPKSNKLIDSKYRSSITEQKLTAIALHELTEGNYEDDNGLKVSIKASAIKRFMKETNDGSFYTKLDKASHALTGRVLGMNNGKEFHYMAVITNADYKDGTLNLTFNAAMKDILTDLSTQYTKINLLEQMSYDSSYSFRISELLQSRMYSYKDEKIDKYRIEFGKAEFYLTIGLCNSELVAVKRILEGSKGSNIDYDKALEISPEKSYQNIADLKKRVINPSVKEINENSLNNIHIDDVEYIRSGRGGKTTSIVFYVSVANKKGKNKNTENEQTENKIDKDDFIDEIADKLGKYGIRYKEIKQICEVSGWNMDKCQKAIKVLDNTEVVDNIVGFLIQAIKQNWAIPIKKERHSMVMDNEKNAELTELEKELLNSPPKIKKYDEY